MMDVVTVSVRDEDLAIETDRLGVPRSDAVPVRDVEGVTITEEVGDFLVGVTLTVDVRVGVSDGDLDNEGDTLREYVTLRVGNEDALIDDGGVRDGVVNPLRLADAEFDLTDRLKDVAVAERVP